MNLIKAIESRMSENDKKQLGNIFAPHEVAVPIEDASQWLTVTRSGEIRSYGFVNRHTPNDPGERAYIASCDGGLSWKLHTDIGGKAIGPCRYIPELDTYICLATASCRPEIDALKGKSGTYAMFSKKGPDDENFEIHKISEDSFHLFFRNYVYIPETDRLIAVTEKTTDDGIYHSVVLVSDDRGKTWDIKYLQSLPRFEMTPPDRAMRWQNHSCEPTITRLADGTLKIICRTSYNYHYQYTSSDNGTNWSGYERSPFHSTLTMPCFKRLSSGRLLFFWCNTQPLPEPPVEELTPKQGDDIISGRWESVFTNRDANHCAYSDDEGRTWHGCREIALNHYRNYSDFRTLCEDDDSRDKSVHQFDAIELPQGKLLLSFGQHISRRLVIMDPKWLEEKSRHEDFRHGLGKVSTQVYVKSVSGGHRGFPGHCAWNRTNGAMLLPDPANNGEEALYITRINDDRLYSQMQGVVWNFPASFAGTVKMRIMPDKDGLSVSLTDRWFNPIDTEVRKQAQISFAAAGSGFAEGEWIDVEIKWTNGKYTAYAGGKIISDGAWSCNSELGLSYLVVQSMKNDFNGGSYIKYFDMKAD